MSSASTEARITAIEEADYEEWEKLFRAYIKFYETSIPDDQYRKTFARLRDPQKDLYGLVLRQSNDERKLLGLAQFLPHSSPWDERQIMLFNGMSPVLPITFEDLPIVAQLVWK